MTARIEAGRATSEEILDRVLRPLARHYEREEIEEIAVCAPGLVFHKLRNAERSGRRWRRHHDPRLTLQYLRGLLHCVANVYKKTFHPESAPLLRCSIPGGHRFTALTGRSVFYAHAPKDRPPGGGISINVRRARNEAMRHGLDAFGVRPTESSDDASAGFVMRATRAHAGALPPDSYQAIVQAASAGHPILLSGPTSSGKTTIIDTLLREISEHVRIIMVEDPLELVIYNDNHVRIESQSSQADQLAKTGASLDGLRPRDIVDFVTRASPDAILVGEIGTANAAGALEVLSTGHSHFWTSIHASHPEEAYAAWAKKAKHTNPDIEEDRVIEELRSMFTVIQTAVDTKSNRRWIAEIVTAEQAMERHARASREQ